MGPTWKVDESKILSKAEVAAVLADLKRKARRSLNTRMNLVIFRLATCCGLRVSELCGLTLANIRLTSDKPHIRIPKTIAKGHKAREVPLWRLGAESPTVRDLADWKAERQGQGAKPGDHFVCSQMKGRQGRKLHRQNARARFISSCRVLGPERQGMLTIHSGRHTCASHLLAGGLPLPVVRDWLGHSNIATTSIYSHVVVDDTYTPIAVFDAEPMEKSA